MAHYCRVTDSHHHVKYEELSENELPSDKSSDNDSGSDDGDPWWHRYDDRGHDLFKRSTNNQHGRQHNRSWRQDNQNGCQDEQQGRRDEQHGRRDEQHGRRDEQHGRRDEQHGRQDEQRGRQAEQHGRRDEQHGRQDEQRGRQAEQHGRRDEQHGRQGHQNEQGTQQGLRGHLLPMSRISMPTGECYSITLPTTRTKVPECGVPSYRITLKPRGRMGRREYTIVKKEMENTIKIHQRSLFTVDVFSRYKIIKIEKLVNGCLWSRYRNRRADVKVECGNANERMLFHGSADASKLADEGLDERYSSMSGLFGAGLYFAEDSSKSDQYAFGTVGCPKHDDLACHKCERQMLLCRVILGKVFQVTTPEALANPPPDHHSVKGIQGNGLEYPEYIVYRGDQVYPEYLITYKTKE